MTTSKATSPGWGRVAVLTVFLGILAGCEEGAQSPFKQSKPDSEPGAATAKSTKLVERDVEAPEVFQVTEAGLWDGRPSLGGVWVAHPDAKDPERVIIRNSANGKFVIGALFRRERAIPGPRIQASSDAAAALGMLAGAPVQLNVTALRRETVEPEPAPEPKPEPAPEPQPVETSSAAAPTGPEADGAITETALDPVAAGAAAAIEATEPEKKGWRGLFGKRAKPAEPAATVASAAAPAAAPEPAVAPTPEATAPARPPARPKSSLDKPYIQIGIFNVEANADRTADQMRSAGIIPVVYEQSSNGKPFWRVLVGPAQVKSDRAALLKKVKAAGFSDAYFVTN